MKDTKMNLNDMTVPQLREIAAELFLNGRSKMRKAELIEAIEAERQRLRDNEAAKREFIQMNETEREQARAEMDKRNHPVPAPPASDHNPVDGRVAAVDTTAHRMSILADTVPHRITTTSVEPVRTKAMITRDVPGAAFFNISDGPSGVIVRYGNVFELVTGSGETITLRARTMVKAVKRLAVKLGIHLDAIDTVKVF
jgi:hypothetical protein